MVIFLSETLKNEKCRGRDVRQTTSLVYDQFLRTDIFLRTYKDLLFKKKGFVFELAKALLTSSADVLSHKVLNLVPLAARTPLRNLSI